MVTRSDLSLRRIRAIPPPPIQLLEDTPLDYIAKTIRGFFAYRDEEYHFNGKVSIIAMTETGLNDYDIRDRLVMLGNDTEAQKAAIRKGAGILVVVWTKEIAPEVIELAKAHHCPIIISGHGTMNTSRYLYFAPPVRADHAEIAGQLQYGRIRRRCRKEEC